jgi:gas vesicle protein
VIADTAFNNVDFRAADFWRLRIEDLTFINQGAIKTSKFVYLRERNQMSGETCSGEKAVFFLVGAAIGAAAALLMAPRSGAETRKLIAARAREGADAVATRSKAVVDVASAYVDRGKDALQQQRDQLSAAFEAGKQAYMEEKDKA